MDGAWGKNGQDLGAIKKRLMERKLELEKELIVLYQDKFSDDQVMDPGDQALSSTMDSIKSSFQNTKIEEYNRVERALEMIEEGTYGICADCERAISEKRLRLFPDATRCLSCQEAHEEGQGPG